MPQVVPISMCQQIVHQTSGDTDVLASVAQVNIVLEAIVLSIRSSYITALVTASFSLGQVGDHEEGEPGGERRARLWPR